jgi:hypothetical protein
MTKFESPHMVGGEVCQAREHCLGLRRRGSTSLLGYRIVKNSCVWADGCSVLYKRSDGAPANDCNCGSMTQLRCIWPTVDLGGHRLQP